MKRSKLVIKLLIVVILLKSCGLKHCQTACYVCLLGIACVLVCLNNEHLFCCALDWDTSEEITQPGRDEYERTTLIKSNGKITVIGRDWKTLACKHSPSQCDKLWQFVQKDACMHVRVHKLPSKDWKMTASSSSWYSLTWAGFSLNTPEQKVNKREIIEHYIPILQITQLRDGRFKQVALSCKLSITTVKHFVNYKWFNIALYYIT